MDETKGTQGVETSEETKGTSEKEPETFTKEEMDEAARKAKSDALADVGRMKKTADTAIKAAQAAEARITQLVKDQEDAELEAARDDAEKLSAIKERQLRRQTESELAKVKSERDEKDEELKSANEERAENTKERNAREIASRLSVKNPNQLVKLAKFTDGSTEAIEDIAKELPKQGDTKTLKVDSGTTIGAGSGKKPTLEEVKAATPAEFDKKVKSGEWKI